MKLSKSPLIAPALGYLALALAVFAPLLPHLAQAIPGGPVAGADGPQNIWNLWWVQRALASGQSPFYTSLLYHPHGTGLYLQTLNASNGLLVAPVTWLFGPVAAYNVALLLAFALSGLGGYLLALRAAGSRAAAFVGGAIFAFSPFHLTKAWDGQLEQVALQWTAFYALFLLRAVEDRRRRDALLAGLFLALVGYTSWYYFFFFAVYTALFTLIWLAPRAGWRARAAMLAQVALAGAAAGALLAPILLPALGALRGADGAGAPAGGAGGAGFNPADPLDLILIHSANLYDFFLPSGLHPLWGAAVARAVQAWHPYIAAWNVALGYTALALALAALALAPRRAAAPGPALDAAAPRAGSPWPWAIITLSALLLALGPVLHVGTARTWVRLPYALLLALPGADIARRPSHFVVIATLALAPLTAIGVRAILERLAPQRRPYALLALALVLAAELAPPLWPMRSFVPHPYYAQLGGQPGALMDLPARAESAAPLIAQIVHQRPIVGGYVSRLPVYPLVWTVPGVRQLWAGAPESIRLLAGEPGDGLAAMAAYGIRTVVVHWDALEGRDRDRFERALAQALPGLEPTFRDERLSVYQLPQVAQRPLAFFGMGWHEEERDGDRRWRWMQPEGEIVLLNPGARARPALVVLAAQAGGEPRDAALLLDDAPLGSWQVGQAPATRAFRILVPPGEHRLRLRAPAAAAPGDGRLLSIAVLAADVRWDVEPEEAAVRHSMGSAWPEADRRRRAGRRAEVNLKRT